jgi:hypothetical protein
LKSPEEKHKYFSQLNNYIFTVRTESEKYHRQVLAGRAKYSVPDEMATIYASGSLVLFKPNSRSYAHKLQPTLLGPYRVVKQERGGFIVNSWLLVILKLFTCLE